MLKKKETLMNKNGVKFEIEKAFSFMYFKWLMDEHNVAKCILYKELKEPLSYHQEMDGISKIIADGVLNLLGKEITNA